MAGLCAIALAFPTVAGAAGGSSARSGDICRDILFAGVAHVVCEIGPAQRRGGLRVDLHWKNGTEPFISLGAVERELERQGRTPLVTMNAGMYEPDLSPVGLFVSGGRVLSPINARAGRGNFYLRPNGVFFMAGGRAGIMETQAFARSKQKPDIATQSGPLMVLGGRIHPRFQADGESRKIRNGIGVRKDGTIVLAISHGGISFGQFARLFRDYLRCPDALYLDGSVSQLSRDGAAGRADGAAATLRKPLGPILSVSVK
ncbi:phosphodiester glycosidase family protein [Pseudochelatococcus sp. B33]